MAVHVVAWVRQKGTGARDEAPHQSRYIEVDAPTFDDAKRLVKDHLEPGWIIGSWRVG